MTDRDRILLVGLADGTVSGVRAEARVRRLPDGPQLLERQRRVRRTLRDGPVPRPPATDSRDSSVAHPTGAWRGPTGPDPRTAC